MLRRFRPRFTFANVVAVVALFLALGGGAYAAFHLPMNSVRSRNIVDGQVRLSDLSNPYVAKAGKQNAISGRISVPDGTGAGKKVAALPGLGRIEVFACNSGTTVFNAQYHNTSTKTEDLWQDTSNEIGVFPMEAPVPPGGTVRLGTSSSNWNQSRLNIGSGMGSGARIGSVDASVVAHGTSTVKCFFQAQGVVSP